jgi:hypothetical protein
MCARSSALFLQMRRDKNARMSKSARWIAVVYVAAWLVASCEDASEPLARVRATALELGADDAGAVCGSDEDAGQSAGPSVLLREEFETGIFPADWYRFDLDGLRPDPSVGFVDAAWVATPEIPPGDATNHVAASTSFHRDWAASDDWMITKPVSLPASATCTLQWRARSDDASFRDDYEVRVFTSAPERDSLAAASTLLLAVAEETITYTTHVQDLAAYAGQTVYLAFHNHAFDKFLLYVDDVTVTCL